MPPPPPSAPTGRCISAAAAAPSSPWGIDAASLTVGIRDPGSTGGPERLLSQRAHVELPGVELTGAGRIVAAGPILATIARAAVAGRRALVTPVIRVITASSSES